MTRKYHAPTTIDFAVKINSFRTEVAGAAIRRRRCGLLLLLSFLWSGAIVARLFSLQVADFGRWQDWAVKQHVSEVQHLSERGPVFDRNNRLLAVSVPAGSVYARPRQIVNKHDAAKAVAEVLDLDAQEVRRDMESPKPFVWIKRQIPRVMAEKVANLKIAGVDYMMESRRLYPFNRAASALIGKVGVDGNGLSGIEKTYEQQLRGDDLKTTVVRDAMGNFIEVSGDNEHFEPPRGNALRLTIDASLQMIVDEELDAGRLSSNAKDAVAVLVDSDTGEVLALSQSPGFNFNTPSSGSKEELRNLVVETVFEPGSIMKPIVTAAALEARAVRPADVIFCENGRYSFARKVIKDVHPYGDLTVHDVVVRSSNIGMTKIGMRLGRERLYEALRTFGFGESQHLDLPGETSGILRPVQNWAMIDVATHSFGQGVAVTPLQVVRAVSAIANGGKLPTLRMVDDGREFEQRRILSEETARTVREMLYGVVENEHGTGTKAAIQGVRIGGKTGTAQKAREGGRGYQPGVYMTSFVGFADASAIGLRKMLTLIVVVDEPRNGPIYGGTIAAPIFKKIMERSVQYLTTKNEVTSPFVEPALPEIAPAIYQKVAMQS